jgi:hypothetical protein
MESQSQLDNPINVLIVADLEAIIVKIVQKVLCFGAGMGGCHTQQYLDNYPIQLKYKFFLSLVRSATRPRA